MVWDAFKCALRGYTIKMASFRQKQIRLKEQNIKKEIDTLIAFVDKSEVPQNVLDRLDVKQQESEQLMYEKANNVYYKNKAEWM